jgi:hypothetical protein
MEFWRLGRAAPARRCISKHMHYNFCRVHKTLRVTPAIQAGVSDHVWELGEVFALLEAAERKP